MPGPSGGGFHPGARALVPMSSDLQDLRGSKSSGTGGWSQGSSSLLPESLHEGEYGLPFAVTYIPRVFVEYCPYGGQKYFVSILV